MNTKNIHFLQKITLILCVFFAFITLLFELTLWVDNDFPGWENNIVFVLDVSQSMNVVDMWNYSRLDAAKRKIIDIVSRSPWNNFALNIFAGESMRILPFTTDIGLISTFLVGLDSNNITKQGSDIESALYSALDSFQEDESWKIVLFTDGMDDDIELSLEIKKLYKDTQLDLIVVGVWSAQWWYIPSNNPLLQYKTYNGNTVISSLNSATLESLSDSIGGSYVHIQDYNDYSSLWEANNRSNFPLIFLLFIASWWLYIFGLYKNLFFKNIHIWNTK